jgi:hypothetical protein
MLVLLASLTLKRTLVPICVSEGEIKSYELRRQASNSRVVLSCGGHCRYSQRLARLFHAAEILSQPPRIRESR